MLTRRNMLKAIPVSAASATLMTTGAAAAEFFTPRPVRVLGSTSVADRELSVSVSAGLTERSWRYGAEQWQERGDTIFLTTGEVVAVRLVNDQFHVAELRLGAVELMRTPANMVGRAVFEVAETGEYFLTLDVGGQSADLSVDIRSTDIPHAPIG